MVPKNFQIWKKSRFIVHEKNIGKPPQKDWRHFSLPMTQGLHHMQNGILFESNPNSDQWNMRIQFNDMTLLIKINSNHLGVSALLQRLITYLIKIT